MRTLRTIGIVTSLTLLAAAGLAGCWDMSKSSFADGGTDTETETGTGEPAPSCGELEWVAQAGAPSPEGYSTNESGIAIDSYSNGDLLVTGFHTVDAVFGAGEEHETTLPAIWCHDMFLAKYDREGALVWAKHVGPEEEVMGNAHNDGRFVKVLDEQGEFVVVGSFQGATEVVFGEGEEEEAALLPTNGMYWDLYLARYNGDGTLAWAKQAGSYSDDTASGAWVSAADDALWVTGAFSADAVFGPGEEDEITVETDAFCYEGDGGKTLFLARYDLETGEPVWVKQAQGCCQPAAISGAADDGYLLVTGRFEEQMILGEGESAVTLESAGGDNPGGEDVFLARFDAETGELDWAVAAGGGGVDIGQSVAGLSDGSALIAGRFEGSATFVDIHDEDHQTITSAHDTGLFVARYTATGDLVWVRSEDVDLYDDFNHWPGSAILQPLPDGDYLIAGSFVDTAVLGEGQELETTLVSRGGFDMFVAQFDSTGELRCARHEGDVDILDSPAGVHLVTDDTLLITGQFGATVTFGEGEPNETTLTEQSESTEVTLPYAGEDIFLMKLSLAE